MTFSNNCNLIWKRVLLITDLTTAILASTKTWSSCSLSLFHQVFCVKSSVLSEGRPLRSCHQHLYAIFKGSHAFPYNHITHYVSSVNFRDLTNNFYNYHTAYFTICGIFVVGILNTCKHRLTSPNGYWWLRLTNKYHHSVTTEEFQNGTSIKNKPRIPSFVWFNLQNLFLLNSKSKSFKTNSYKHVNKSTFVTFFAIVTIPIQNIFN